MAMKFKTIVPWGRNLYEYRRMFDLSCQDLRKRILGCGDGPASFNVECRQQGGRIVSIDPIYTLTCDQIRKRVQEAREDVLRQAEENRDKYKWELFSSVDDLGRVRMEAMSRFLKDFRNREKRNAYVAAGLPHLPFADRTFDISLSSHFLFLYTDHLTYSFHIRAVREMLRVSDEIRIFPLLDLTAKKSPYVKRILSDFCHCEIEIRKVNYEFQIGGNEVLIIRQSNQ